MAVLDKDYNETGMPIWKLKSSFFNSNVIFVIENCIRNVIKSSVIILLYFEDVSGFATYEGIFL